MPPQSDRKRIAVIGAGPIGIETALYARRAGYQVLVIEQGDTIAANVHKWKHVTLFSPFRMNCSVLGKQILSAAGHSLPDDDAYVTGAQYIDRYLEPLAASPLLCNHIHTQCKVLAVSRDGILKNEHIGDGKRSLHPFRILTRRPDGCETFFQADYVIDTSGSYDHPNNLGNGGIPAAGETDLRERIAYHLPDMSNGNRQRYIGKITLLVGGGHSAATTATLLHPLLDENSQTQLFWLTRRNRPEPVVPIPGDPLNERKRTIFSANSLVNHPRIHWIKQGMIQALTFDNVKQSFSVSVNTPEGDIHLDVDNIIANVGYSPDNRIYRELQIHECYASRGPMKLAAALLSDSSADCLRQSSKGPAVLTSPEPDFYIIGMKSYGKNSNFLLRIGHEQIRDVFTLICGSPELNLYDAKQLSKRKSTAFLEDRIYD